VEEVVVREEEAVVAEEVDGRRSMKLL